MLAACLRVDRGSKARATKARAEILSRGLEVRLVNARQLRNVPGRKTDMLDCQWLQVLHSCGLLRGSFRPKEAICRLRALHRQVGNLVEERTRSVQWMQQALDQMNVQVHTMSPGS